MSKSEIRSVPFYQEVIGSVDGLRRGITTGTCAQAASKGAVLLLTGEMPVEDVSVTLPKGRKPFSGKTVRIRLSRCGWESSPGEASGESAQWSRNERGRFAAAGVIKDAGDDNDVTDGIEITAYAEWCDEAGLKIDGGPGVGKVTKDGLPVPVGEYAINPGPLRMIRQELKPFLPKDRGIRVEIRVPMGEEVAQKTWNPRLGIEGGISIIGNSGVVEPKSSSAFKASLSSFVRAAVKQGKQSLIVTPGYVGEKFLFSGQKVPRESVITVADHIGFTVIEGVKRGLSKIVIAGHIGKTVKLAAGIFDTHSKYGDARLETLAAWAAWAGADQQLIRSIMECRLAEQASALLLDAGYGQVFDRIAEKGAERLAKLAEGKLEIGIIVLALNGSVLGAYPEILKEESGWKNFMY